MHIIIQACYFFLSHCFSMKIPAFQFNISNLVLGIVVVDYFMAILKSCLDQIEYQFASFLNNAVSLIMIE